MTNNKFQHRRYPSTFLLAIIFFAVAVPVHAQNDSSAERIKVLLIDSESKGFTKSQSDLFFSRLQKKVAQFEQLSVYLKSDLKKELNTNEKVDLDSCSALYNLSCLQKLLTKSGTARVIFCSLSRQDNQYRFISAEYDVINYLKLTESTNEADCTTSGEINQYITDIAVTLGQNITGTDDVPDSLSTPVPSWYWYAGGAAIVGAGAGIYLLTRNASDDGVIERTLPAAPSLP